MEITFMHHGILFSRAFHSAAGTNGVVWFQLSWWLVIVLAVLAAYLLYKVWRRLRRK